MMITPFQKPKSASFPFRAGYRCGGVRFAGIAGVVLLVLFAMLVSMLRF